MKVILLVDVKGHGKKDEIKDLPSGYANFLIKNHQAVMANDSNIDILHEEQAKAKEEALKLLQEMQNLKVLIEQKKYSITVQLGANGLILGTITPKMVIEAVEKELPNVKLDKRKLTFEGSGQCLGDNTANIVLHPQVTAKIKYTLIKK